MDMKEYDVRILEIGTPYLDWDDDLFIKLKNGDVIYLDGIIKRRDVTINTGLRYALTDLITKYKKDAN